MAFITVCQHCSTSALSAAQLGPLVPMASGHDGWTHKITGSIFHILVSTRCLMLADTCDGAGQVLAAAIKGVNNGLHSRAAPLLRLLLQQDLLAPVDFKAQQGQQASVPSSTQLQALAAAVTRTALAQLLDHLRRGKGQVLWECVLSEAHARLEACLSPGTCLGICVCQILVPL